ncbi:pilus assembly protein Flp/PilA [Sinomonas atrocyanea]|uniref:Flp family type IVb pilin n=1 Tax=Sinomonas atrocyanea TaxID=37927 RepID=UPI00277E3780|nr:Flp family type IVb pilin [Sinomonas atrocyanea]MDQ0258724.1 pilus assembly protein Flp/PilA [Sinomonas atrocyanea]
MNQLVTSLLVLWNDLTRDGREKGATAVEYGLLVALIAAVIIGTVVTLGGQINSAFTTISSQL